MGAAASVVEVNVCKAYEKKDLKDLFKDEFDPTSFNDLVKDKAVTGDAVKLFLWFKTKAGLTAEASCTYVKTMKKNGCNSLVQFRSLDKDEMKPFEFQTRHWMYILAALEEEEKNEEEAKRKDAEELSSVEKRVDERANKIATLLLGEDISDKRNGLKRLPKKYALRATTEALDMVYDTVFGGGKDLVDVVDGLLENETDSGDEDSISSIGEVANMASKITRFSFPYSPGNDSRGIVYYLGAIVAGGDDNDTKWKNPHQLVRVSRSSVSQGKDYHALERNSTRIVCTTNTNPGNGNWFAFDFSPTKCGVRPSAFTLRHGFTKGKFVVQRFVLEGSNDDGMTWAKLHEVDDASEKWSKNAQTWTLDDEDNKTAYKILRIRMTGPNSDGSWTLCLNGFEVFGDLRRTKQ